MNPLFDERGHVSRDPQVLALLKNAIERDLGQELANVRASEQQWGAGGGMHFSAVWRRTCTEVLIKLGVNENQLYWVRHISAAAPALGPVLFAAGESLGDLPVGWTVTERVQFNCMGPQWQGLEFPMLLEAAVCFQQVARGIPPKHMARVDETLLSGWLEEGLRHSPPGPVEALFNRMPSDFRWLESVCQWENCHGDIQMCNGMTRQPPLSPTPLLLIDCQPIIQPWAFDAGYLQVINSIDKSRKGYKDLIPMMASMRAKRKMVTPSVAEVERMSAIILGWFAIRQWGRNPERREMHDYVDETARYLRDAISV